MPPQLALLPQTHFFNPIDNTLNIEMEQISKVERMGKHSAK